MFYSITGKVIHGDGYGKKIGFPTMNLSRNGFVKLKKKPAYGVYCGRGMLGNVKYPAGIIIGPNDKNGLPKIEAHLIGYGGNAYGKTVVFELKQFLRKYKIFKTEKELIAQIQLDLKKC